MGHDAYEGIRRLEEMLHIEWKNFAARSYKKKAAAAPRATTAGAMVIIGAPAVDCSTTEAALDLALVALDLIALVSEAKPDSDPEAEAVGETREMMEPVGVALLAEGVAAAEALGSRSSPAVTMTGKAPK